MKILRPSFVSFALISAGCVPLAFAVESGADLEMPTVEIIGATPLGGVGVPLSQFPANAQTLSAKDANEQGDALCRSGLLLDSDIRTVTGWCDAYRFVPTARLVCLARNLLPV
jgi:hypothetical protein